VIKKGNCVRGRQVNITIPLITIVLLLCLLIAAKAKKPRQKDGLDFTRVTALFTPAERSFLGVLEQAIDSRYRVFGKVRLADIVTPAQGLTARKRTIARNRINQKHVDFLLCTAADLAPIGVLELDDRSHERKDRADRDEFVDRALARAGIPVVHFPAGKGYVLQEVRAKLAEVLPEIVPPVLSAPLPAENVQKNADDTAKWQEATTIVERIMGRVHAGPEPTAPACPKCAAIMVKRQALRGTHAGKWFWACSAFPKCRQAILI
jgi:very-short-patch-repair endonuclease